MSVEDHIPSSSSDEQIRNTHDYNETGDPNIPNPVQTASDELSDSCTKKILMENHPQVSTLQLK